MIAIEKRAERRENCFIGSLQVHSDAF